VPPTAATRPPVVVNPALKVALLGAADLPGAVVGPAGRKVDLTACFPGNPAGAAENQNQAIGPAVGIVQGRVQRTYTSRAVEVGPKQAAAFVATFASAAGSACVTTVIKTAISGPLSPKVDSSGLSGTVKPAPIADAGAVLTVKGNLKVNGTSVPVASDVAVFHKGQVVVMVTANAAGGATVANQAVDLARKIAGRLP